MLENFKRHIIPLAFHFSGFDLVLFSARDFKKYGNSSAITALLKTPSAKNNVTQKPEK